MRSIRMIIDFLRIFCQWTSLILLKLIFAGLLISGCNYPGEGSLGGWELTTFPVGREKLANAVDSLRNVYPDHRTPEKWIYDAETWQQEAGGLKDVEVIYVKGEPEVMYGFSYIPSDEQKSKETIIALRSVFEDREWIRRADFDINKQKHISERFRKDVVRKLELILKTSAVVKEIEYSPQETKSDDKKVTSDFVLEVRSGEKRNASHKLRPGEKIDSLFHLLDKKFDHGSVLAFEKVCQTTDDYLIPSLTTSVEELFYRHLKEFSLYYIANPKSCLKGKLIQSMEEYLEIYELNERNKKLAEKRNRVLNDAHRQGLSTTEITFINNLFNSINIRNVH